MSFIRLVVCTFVLIDWLSNLGNFRPFEFKSIENNSNIFFVEAKNVANGYWKTKRHDNVDNVHLDLRPFDFPSSVDIELFDVFQFKHRSTVENTTATISIPTLNITQSIDFGSTFELRFNKTGKFEFRCQITNANKKDLESSKNMVLLKSIIFVWSGNNVDLFFFLDIEFFFFFL